MKNIFLQCSLLFFCLILVFSCDKVKQIYKPKTYDTTLDISLYPGEWQTYLDNEWPDFDTIVANPSRNILIEDFTGHNCQFCPAAATAAHQLHIDHPQRVFVSSIHSSPTGITGFQAVNAQYPVDFTNPIGLELGMFFGNLATSGFIGNPSVGSSRIKVNGSTELYYPAGLLSTEVTSALASASKATIRTHMNYYPQTKGVFLHTAIDILDEQLSNLGAVVVIQQDSLIAPQNVNGTYQANYIHRDIHRQHLSNSLWGVTLTDELKQNNTYYLDYSFIVPNSLTADNSTLYQAENMHVLVYVYDKESYEIYQVVRQNIVGG